MNHFRRDIFRPRSISLLLGLLLGLTQVAGVARAQTTNRDQIRAKIAGLEREEESLNKVIASDKEMIPLLDRDTDYFFVPASEIGSIPLKKKDVIWRLEIAVLTGKMTRQEADDKLNFYPQTQKIMQAELRKELPQLEQQLTKTRDQISYYVNELARLNEAAAQPNSVVGAWTWAFAEKGDPQTNGSVTFDSDGTMTWSGGSSGTWTQSGRTISLQWKGKDFKDTMTLSEDGKTMAGTNNAGWQVQGTR
jgi:hypothetical protein